MISLYVLDIVSLVANIVGMVIILWGAIVCIVKFLYIQYATVFQGEATEKQINYLRGQMASYILMGLEFMIAGDIIHTILKPDQEALIVLGSIVVIRTIISYFLTLEQKDILTNKNRSQKN